MAKILFFNSEHECVLLDRKVEDGMVNIGDKTFLVDTSYPLLLRTKFGYTPLYIVKWNQIKPANNIHSLFEKTERVNPKFEGKKDEITPSMLRRLIGMRILGNMIPFRRSETPNLFLIIIGLAIGVFLTYFLINMGLLPR